MLIDFVVLKPPFQLNKCCVFTTEEYRGEDSASKINLSLLVALAAV